METGVLGCDMMLVAEPAFSLELKEAGYLEPIEVEGADTLLRFPYDEEGYWYPVRVCNMVLAYNPEMVDEWAAKGVTIPKTFQDFANDPSLKGYISMGNPLTSGTTFAAVASLTQDNHYGESYLDGLAANEVLKDMFAGLEISIYKPFDIGSRIMLEDGRAGIVEKLTLRHVVLRLIDTTRVIIPNSKANQSIIVNDSYAEHVPRSFDVRFGIGYNSDIDKAKEIIRQTICDCPLTLNKDRYKEDDPNSKSEYFLEIADSAIILGATIYYPHELRTEVVKDEVNTRIFKALCDNGIEIPYNYVNMIMKKENADD
jgi:hypothetical protein